MKSALINLLKNLITLALMFGFCLTMTLVYRSEVGYHHWRARQDSVQTQEDHVRQVAKSQKYSAQLLSAVNSLALENGLLCERDQQVSKYVSALDEENARLKASLAEAVKRLQSQEVELNEVYDELLLSQYRVEVLEKALGLLPELDPTPFLNVMEGITDFLSSFEVTNAESK